MGLYYYTLFTIFTIIAVMVVLDANVGDYIILLLKSGKLNVERLIWKIRFHPNNPIGRYLMWRRSLKLAKQLQEEFNKKNE